MVFLGSGLLQGLAREAALKLGELSNGAVATCFDTPLGFRHGPKTFLTQNTAVFAFVSNDPLTRLYDHDLLDELRRDGIAARVVEPGCRAAPATGHRGYRHSGDGTGADIDLVWPCVAARRIYAFHASLVRGLTPTTQPGGTVNRVVQGVRIHGAP